MNPMSKILLGIALVPLIATGFPEYRKESVVACLVFVGFALLTEAIVRWRERR